MPTSNLRTSHRTPFLKAAFGLVLFSSLFLGVRSARADITSNLLLHYTLDDNAANTTIVDSQGTSNGTTATGNTNTFSSTTAKYGTSFGFNGSSQYASTNYVWSSSNSSFTLSAWIKSKGTGDNYAWISSYAGQLGYIGAGMNVNGYATCFVNDSSNNSSGVTAFSAPLINDGKWHLETCVEDGTTMTLYIDGVSVGTDTNNSLTGNYRDVFSDPLIIGKSGSTYWTGNVDDIRIYNRALSSADVKELGGLDTKLAGWWKFDEGSGTTAADSSGNDNTGTLVNSADWTSSSKLGAYAEKQLVGTGGSGSYVTTANTLNGDHEDESYTAWVYPTDLTGQSGHNIFFFTQDGWLEVLSNGQFNFHGRDNADYTYTGATIPLNTWTHLALTCSDTTGGTGTATFYINGSQVYQVSNTVLCYNNLPGTAVIGGYGNGGYGWTGNLDDVRYYLRVLTPTEISQIYLLGAPQPPQISSMSVSTTTTTATITWTTDQTASSTVNYGLTSGYGSASTTDTLVTSHQIILSNLTPGTVYHYQVASGNTNGVSTSSDYTFTTAADTTPPNISAIASSTLNTTATVTWTTDEVATSKVAYGTVTGAYTLSSTSPSLVTSHSIGLTSLTSGTTYFYVVVSADASGNISTSTEKTLTTASSADTTPPVISSISVSSIGTSTATITWTTDEAASTTVRFGLDSSYGFSSSTASLVTSHQIILNFLSASTTYHYQVSSGDASGNYATSSDLTFSTASSTSFTWCTSGHCATFHNGDVVALVGDSISSINFWTAYFESYLALHYPSIHIHFRDLSRSGAAIPNYTSGGQYMGQVDPLSPNTVILMMTNNGGFTAAQYIAQVQDFFTNYVATSSAQSVIFDVPPMNTADGGSPLDQYSDNLLSYATSNAIAFAGQTWNYLHTIWATNLASSTPVDIQDGGDTDHMGPPAHLGIAYSYLNTIGAESLVSSTTIDAATATIVSEQNTVISNVATTSQGINFTRLDARLPMAYDDRSLPIFIIMPQIYDQNKYMLTVSGLSAGDYYVYVDGIPSGSVSSTQLAAGWNMSKMTSGPIHDQGQDVLNKIRTKAGLDRVTRATLSPNTGVVEYISNANSCYIDQGLTGAALKSCVATAISDVNTLDTAIYAAAQPTAHTFSLQKASGSADITPPVISNPSPSSALAQGTTQTTLSVHTDEAATCKYDTVSQTPYIWMANAFTETVSSTTHSATITGLLDGVTYTYYIRCQDAFGNRNMTDYTLTFSVNADPNPIMQYEFEEGTGSSAADISGNSHTATLQNSPSWVTGKLGNYALSFNGTNNVATVGDVSDADNIGALTATAWVKGGGSFTAGNNYTVISKFLNGQGVWTLGYSGSSSDYDCTIVNAAGTSVTAGGPTVARNDTNWHHVACVYDGTKVVIYTDGATSTNANDSPALTGALKDTNYPVCIGGTTDGTSCITSSAPWSGSLDDVRVYKRALSAAEITNLYQGTPPVISGIATSTTTTTATVTWTTDVIASSTINYGLNSSYGSASTSDSFVTSHTITLTGLTPSTVYHYQVASAGSFANIATSSDQTFTTAASVDTTPPVISSIASSTGANTATITWTTDEGANSTVSYGLTTSYGNASTTASFVTSHTILLSGLLGSTVYHFKITSADSSNNTSNSSDLTFTTSPDIAAAPSVTTSAASSVSTTSLTLNGSITSTHGFDASQSGLAYGTASDLHTVIATTTLGAQTGTASFSSSLSSLTPNTTYYFRAYATNIQGTGYGSIQSTTTLPVSKPTVTTQAASAVDVITATGNGTIVATGNINATARGFIYGTNAGYGATTTPQTGDFSTGAFTGSITGLTCGTTYHYAAYATNSQGTGYGSDQTFTPPCLTSLANISASSVNSTTETITWASDVAASSIVDFGINSSYGTTTPEFDTASRVTSHSVTLAPLVACTIYHYRARSKDASNTQVTGSDATFTTSGCTASASVSTSTVADITGSGGTLNALDTNNLGLALTVPSSFSSTTSQASFQAKKLNSSTFTGSVASPSGLTLVSSYIYNLEALKDATTSLHSFDNPLTVSITYSDSDITNFDPATLVIERYDGSTWTLLSGNTVSTSTKTVTATTTSFSDFGLFGVYTAPVTNSNGGGGSSSSSSGGGGFSFWNWFANLFTKTQTLGPATTTVPVPVAPKVISPLSLSLVFTRNLYVGMKGNDVKQLQIFLNLHGFTVAKTGPGSKGNETTFFGAATEAAVKRFQAAYAKEVLYSSGLKAPTGTFGPATRKQAVKISMGQQ